MLIDFVGNDNNVLVTKEHVLQPLQFLTCIYGTCGVAGRAQYQCACLLGDGSLQLFGSDLEVLLDGGGNEHGSGIGQKHHVGVAYPIGSGYDNLVASTCQSHDDVADALLGTIGAQNLAGLVFQTVLSLQFLHDGFLQFGVAGHGAIAAPVVLNGLDACCLDVVGGVEVGLAHTHIDDIHALSLQLAALLAHGQSCAC